MKKQKLIPPQLLKKALDSSSSSIVLSDATKSGLPIVYVNKTFQRLTGYAPSEVLGRNCRFMQGVDRKQAPIAQLRRAIHNRSACRVVLRNYKKNDSMFWNELYLSPVVDSAGKLTHYIGVQTDVTARVEAEQKLADHLKNLEKIVAERTQSLEQKNIALKELLSQLEFEKKSLQDRLATNIDRVLLPLVTRLASKHGLPPSVASGLRVLEKGLKEVFSSFGLGVSKQLYRLSPREVELCHLIKSGLSTKEISGILGVSISTVENQRNSIRHKLKISSQSINLTTFLNTL